MFAWFKYFIYDWFQPSPHSSTAHMTQIALNNCVYINLSYFIMLQCETMMYDLIILMRSIRSHLELNLQKLKQYTGQSPPPPPPKKKNWLSYKHTQICQILSVLHCLISLSAQIVNMYWLTHKNQTGEMIKVDDYYCTLSNKAIIACKLHNCPEYLQKYSHTAPSNSICKKKGVK